MKTKGEIRSVMLRYLDEATKKGVYLPTTKNADYRDKFDYFLYSALKYIATIIKIPEVFTITQYAENDALYTGVFEYAMPSDFMELDSIIFKRDNRSYEAYTNYKWENNNRVVLGFYDVGVFDIHYYKYPATVLPSALDTTQIEIEEKAVDLVALQVAIKATAADNPSLSSWLRSLYIEEVQNITSGGKPIQQSIQTIYSIGG